MVQINVDQYVKFQLNESVLRSNDYRLVPMNVFLRKWMANNANERILNSKGVLYKTYSYNMCILSNTTSFVTSISV